MARGTRLTNRTKWFRAVLLFGVFAMFATACGDDSSADAPGDDVETAEEPAAEEPAAEEPAAEEPAAEEPAADEPAAEEPAADEPTRGGSITVGGGAALTSLDPARITGGGIGHMEAAAIYGSLVRYDRTDGTFEPYLAASLTPNDALDVWTITLRDDVFFTDGTVYDSAIVKRNIERMIDPDNNAARGSEFKLVESMDTPDPLTIIFNLSDPLSSFGSKLGYPTWIAAAAYLDGVEDDPTMTPIGAGPFIVDSFLPEESTTLVPNPTYIGPGPYLDEVKFVYIGEASQSFIANDIDFVLINTKDEVPAQNLIDGGYPLDLVVTPGRQAMAMNAAEGTPFNDVRLREAASISMDVDFWVDSVQQGTGVRTNQLFHEGTKWYDPALTGPPLDRERAAELVEAVKADNPDWDGTIDYICQSDDPATAQFPVYVKSQLEPVGFKINVIPGLTQTARVDRLLVDRDFDLACWTISYATYEYDMYDATQRYLESDQRINIMSFVSPEIDALVDKFRLSVADDEVRPLVAELIDIWNRTFPMIIMGSSRNGTRAYSEDLMGLVFERTTHFDRAYLESEQ